MTPEEKRFYRVSGLLLAHDPFDLKWFSQHDEYDAYVAKVLACKDHRELARVLVDCNIEGEPLFRSLKYFLGFHEPLTELYGPCATP